MKKLFESATVGGLSLRNRFIRSATFEYVYDNENEVFADRLLPMYEKLAGNGVAAIITGMVGVDENSRAASVMVKAYGQSFVPELARLADGVHALGTKLSAHQRLIMSTVPGRPALPNRGKEGMPLSSA